MNEADLWVQWWSFAWRHAHPDWHCADEATWPPALTRNRHVCVSKALANCICRPAYPGPLDTAGHLWCQRLARALHTPAWLNQSDDALHLLKAWVEPPVWQRLRLCFARARVMALEQTSSPRIAPSRLDIFWQAVLWRAHFHPG